MTAPDRTRRGHLLDLSPLRESPGFARLWAGSSISAIGGQMTIVAVGLHIYDITRSTTAVSLVALFALVPMIVFGLYGGVLADSMDRRRLALISSVAAWASTACIAALSWSDSRQVLPLYLLVTLNAVATTVVGSTRAAITPRLLPMRLLPAASALQGIGNGVSITVGPALAGVLVATVGISWTYTIDVILYTAAFTGIFTLPAILPEGERRSAGIRSVIDGIGFLREAKNIRMTFIVDLFAMTFGQPRVLFPAVGAIVIGGGPITVGILTAASAVGTLLSSLFSGRLGHVRLQGRAVERSVEVYGACIVGFGVVLAALELSGATSRAHSLAALPPASWIALTVGSVLLAGSGAADNVSSIFRNTILQAAVPDHMRGRLQGIFTVVVTGGPRLGDLYVGALAAFGVLWLPPLVGGIVVIVGVAWVVHAQRSFRRYDALTPEP